MDGCIEIEREEKHGCYKRQRIGLFKALWTLHKQLRLACIGAFWDTYAGVRAIKSAWEEKLNQLLGAQACAMAIT
jgi:hypothetical protein